MKSKILTPLFVGLALVLAMVVSQFGPVQEASALAPTPVANILTSDNQAFFRFQPTTAITADTNTNSILLGQFNSIDVQYTIDQGTVNTTTLTIQYSNDGSNWDDGAALATNNAADATDITRVPMFGRYARIKQDVSNSNTITITLTGFAR